MSDPNVPQKAPYPVDVSAGQKVFWCTCGRSDSQPFCDGSHKDTSFTPMPYTAEEDKTLYFCGCKHTAGAPLCDGSHNKL
jgi:CDGSH-type Zn-finger protein